MNDPRQRWLIIAMIEKIFLQCRNLLKIYFGKTDVVPVHTGNNQLPGTHLLT